eukprot:355792-Chlamydomonas_euryale.AAC.7
MPCCAASHAADISNRGQMAGRGSGGGPDGMRRVFGASFLPFWYDSGTVLVVSGHLRSELCSSSAVPGGQRR